MYSLLTPPPWSDYELIDAGNSEKLERFGSYVLCRPEPQALWDKGLSHGEWEKRITARYIRKKGQYGKTASSNRSEWKLNPGMPEHWFIQFGYKEMNLKIRLALTSSGHIGIFPEQAINWTHIYDHLTSQKDQNIQILNLFAYTGIASLVARFAGAGVVHVDSVKQTVNWSHVNMDANGLSGIRWVVEDAMKFIRREVTRGNKYHGIIMDPPAYGRGPAGEKWILEDGINELVTLSKKLLHEDNGFFILNFYSLGLSALVVGNLVREVFHVADPELGEFYISSSTGFKLPLGTFLRFKT
jgi:23S rRNA (cytosine1962-C5)-methyltransferase